MDRVTAPPLPLEEAQARLLALASPLTIEHVDVEGALGRYLAEPLHARRTQPAASLSAMDGYAVAGLNLTGPWRVVGESAAGHPYIGTIAIGEAVRISTGAVLPADASAVILQEDLARHGDEISLTGEAPVPATKHIRPRGMDFIEGAEILPRGKPVGPAQTALAIAAGHKYLPVSRKPRVVIIDSGDELAADPEHCAPHQIPASNGAMLLALAGSTAVDARRIGPVPDTIKAITSTFEASSDADLIVTSGGASVGDHDLIRPALERWGASIDFWRVAIKPGKPILVATRDTNGRRQIVLGLPGNPVSSYVTAYHFMLPMLRAMLGAAQPLPMHFTASLGEPLRANGKRREFLRGWWNGETVIANPLQDSGALSSIAASNVLIDRAAFAEDARVNDKVQIYLLQNGGIA
ncbi:molybdopterin molybdotransferase MoeA [Novosphingobium kaempferiae]|uniref:molybdopterin molybdotransferase MoeA n=1 Tax=Novosphingobium kaempferiae TaxID=2896849 RepID=UPI001E3BB11E|nr:molybdopterin molybdotransferase MoeA [Novosphingobium kaempferiae]